MLKKEEVIDLLNSMINDENKDKIEHYIEKVSKVEEKQWKVLLESQGIKTLQDAQKFVTDSMDSKDFIALNELVSYIQENSTISLHVGPPDVKNLLSRKGLEKSEYLLIDALEKIQIMLQEDKNFENIEQIHCVSGLIRKPISVLFENLDFDIKTMKSKLAKNDEELQKFYEHFKDKKYIGRAKLSKEKLLSEDWNKRKEQRKEQILASNKELKTNSEEGEKLGFRKDLEQVYSQETVARNANDREKTEKQISDTDIVKETNIII